MRPSMINTFDAAAMAYAAFGFGNHAAEIAPADKPRLSLTLIPEMSEAGADVAHDAGDVGHQMGFRRPVFRRCVRRGGVGVDVVIVFERAGKPPHAQSRSRCPPSRLRLHCNHDN